MVRAGTGRHQYYLTLLQVSAVVGWNTAYQLSNVLSTWAVKMSILLFLLRMQPSKSFARQVYFVMLLLSVINTVFVAAIGAQCIPLEKAWKPTIPGHCIGASALGKFGYAQGGIMMPLSYASLEWHS